VLTGLQWKVGEGFEFCIPLGTVADQRRASTLRSTFKIWDDAGQSTLVTMDRIEVPEPTLARLENPDGTQKQEVADRDAATDTDPVSGGLTSSQARRAQTIHQQAWEDVVKKAATDDYFKYSLYTSRTLAVRHPEIYLQGDALFLEHITSTDGYASAYKDRNPHSPQYTDTSLWFSGPSFSLDEVDFRDLSRTSCLELYPDGAPFYPFLDRRVMPMSSCLKTTDEEVTELEKAFLLYFQWKEKHLFATARN